jgi:hypothetical protein
MTVNRISQFSYQNANQNPVKETKNEDSDEEIKIENLDEVHPDVIINNDNQDVQERIQNRPLSSVAVDVETFAQKVDNAKNEGFFDKIKNVFSKKNKDVVAPSVSGSPQLLNQNANQNPVEETKNEPLEEETQNRFSEITGESDQNSSSNASGHSSNNNIINNDNQDLRERLRKRPLSNVNVETPAQKVDKAKKGGSLDAIASFMGLAPGPLVQGIVDALLKAFDGDHGVVEHLVEKWMGEPYLFQGLQKAVEELGPLADNGQVSDAEFTKKFKEVKDRALAGVLKRWLSELSDEVSESATKKALNTAFDGVIDKLMEGSEEEGNPQEVNRLGRRATVLEVFSHFANKGTEILNKKVQEQLSPPQNIGEKNIYTTLEALLDSFANKGAEIFSKKLQEQLSPPQNAGEKNVYTAVEALTNSLAEQLREKVEDTVKEVVDPRLAPLNTFLNEVTHTIQQGKKAFNIPPAPNLGSSEVRYVATTRVSDSSNNTTTVILEQREVNNSEEGGIPNVMPFGNVRAKLMEYFNGMLGGVAESVLPFVVNKLARGFKYGVEQAKSRITRPKEGQDQENGVAVDDAVFDILIEDLEFIIEHNERPPLEKLQKMLAAMRQFSQYVADTGGEITIDGIPIPLFLFEEGADFGATPAYDNAVAEKGVTPQRTVKSKKRRETVSLNPFKKNISRYAGALFVYKVIGGLNPKTNFYRDLFAHGKKDSELKRVFFSILDKAHQKGEISMIRMWVTKLMYSLVQPICKLLIEPFIDNGDKQTRSLEKKEIAEGTVQEFIKECCNYSSSIVNAYHEIAEGRGDLSKGIDDAMMEKLKEPAFNGGKTLKESHLQAAETGVDDLGLRFTFADHYFKRLSSMGFSEKSILRILNPLISLLKIIPYIVGSVFLYPLQEVMTWGMKRLMKTVAMHVDVLDGVVEKGALAADTDLNLKRALLLGIKDFYVNAITNVKNPEASAADQKVHLLEGDKKKIRSIIANVRLAMEYSGVDTVDDLAAKIKSKREPAEKTFSIFGIGLDLGEEIDKKVKKSIVDKVAEIYERAMDENLLAQQVNGIKEMMNNAFDQKNSLDTKSLKKEIQRLERENEQLLEELIRTIVKTFVDEQFDMSGGKQIRNKKLNATITAFKETIVIYVKGQKEKIQQLNLAAPGIRQEIKVLRKQAVKSGKKVTDILLEPKNKTLKEKRYNTFVQLHAAYLRSLDQLHNQPSVENQNAARVALEDLQAWQKGIPFAKGTNIELFPELVEKVVSFIKGGVRDHVKQQAEEFKDLMLKPYNIMGVANMGVAMYADRRFPFQKAK